MSRQYLVLALFFILVTSCIVVPLLEMSDGLINITSKSSAKIYSDALGEFRSLYTSEVVARVNKEHVKVTYDYKNYDGAIPLPATFSILLGNSIGIKQNGSKAQLYSAYPYSWRNKEGGLKDQFKKDAWAALNQNPSKPYYKFIDTNGEKTLRYATADVMRSNCIGCHNNSPISPKRDWRIGDVVGVLEVSRPLGEVIAETKATVRTTMFIQLSTIIVIFAILIFLQFRLVRTSKDLSRETAIKKELTNTQLQLVKSLELAQAATKAKSAFLATMSHEIRTPMNGILGMANLLSKESLNKKQLERVNIIRSCGDSLLTILNDILSFSKLEAKKVELETVPTNLDQCVREVIELLRESANKNHNQIAYEKKGSYPLWINGDPTRIKQILINLIGNSIKFTNNGLISINISEKQMDLEIFEYTFAITDTGRGISQKQISEIFQPFSQEDSSTTRLYGGTGLGLSICKSLAELMGGRIWAESELSKGSTFYFSIHAPRAQAEVNTPLEIRTQDEYPNLAQALPIKILVADDNPYNVIVAQDFLEKLGYNSDSARNGLDVVELSLTNNYDLILMDCYMPKLDGFSAAREILTNTKIIRKPAIIGTTASITQSDRDRCFEVGMIDVLLKPISPQSLVTSILRSLNRTDLLESIYKTKNHITPSINLDTTTFQIIDHRAIFEHFPNHARLLSIFIKQFISEKETLLQNLEKASRSNSPGDLKTVAHYFQGVVCNFFVKAMQERLSELDDLASSGQVKGADLIIAQLKEDSDKLTCDLSLLSDIIDSDRHQAS